jgi:hypothetical protein
MSVESALANYLETCRLKDLEDQQKGLLFKVVTADGHIYKVFTDGQIEGFVDGCRVVNYFPILLATEKAKWNLPS